MLNYVDMKLRRDVQERSVEGGIGGGGILAQLETEEEKLSDIQLTKLLLDIP